MPRIPAHYLDGLRDLFEALDDHTREIIPQSGSRVLWAHLLERIIEWAEYPDKVGMDLAPTSLEQAIAWCIENKAQINFYRPKLPSGAEQLPRVTVAIGGDWLVQRETFVAAVEALSQQVHAYRLKHHPPTDECPDQECCLCGERDCPHSDPLHYHHDGCPSCSFPNPHDVVYYGEEEARRRAASQNEGSDSHEQ